MARDSGRPGRRGELSFKLDRREIGHLHGDHAGTSAFPGGLGRLIAQGRIVPHPVFPDAQDWRRRIESDADIDDVIELLRLQLRPPAPAA